MLNLDKMETERESAEIDKADLFVFYHKHWSAVIAELRELRQFKDETFQTNGEQTP